MTDVKTGKVLLLEGRYSEALELFLAGAREGCPECAFHYAYMHLKGLGTERDYSVARSYFTFCSDSIGEACYNLAVMYMDGLGTLRDYRRAYSYMHDAAEKGIIEAQLYLGTAHTIGYMLEPNVVSISLSPYHTAEYRETLAALEGEITEQEADEERRIRAVRMDHRSAFEWFRLSASNSSDYVEELSHNAKYLYARCYLDGLGVGFNRDKANALMLLAAADGSPQAMEYLETDAPYVLESLKNKKLIEAIRRTEKLSPP